MRRTVDGINPVLLGSFDKCKDDIVITIPNAGQILYISHYRHVLLQQTAGTQEGTPLTSLNGDGGGPIHRLKWTGELWAQGSVQNQNFDIEGV